MKLFDFSRLMLMLSGAVLGSGCSGAPDTELGGSEPAAAAERGPDLRRGELLALACAACHTFDAGGRNLVGPNLHGVFGRQAASLEGFEYSTALRAAGIVWTPELLDQWLAEPTGFVPGTTMAFSGYRRAEDRRDLIAYLVAVTAR